ncbi:hypothetical protein AV530_007008 [Patagioenas fasciata monilis]|uniref:Lon N-terminal domain-containing protein n=1 Tax=Patagioenas fasciata monilis TaxID=372326 RepID=A0A1V4JQ41_PATFA|nr:hypothetical protein AV530_007008 [Patagioenas fasciata monilis]
MAAGSAIQIPSRLPLLLTQEGVLLPGSTMRTSVDSPRNMQLVRSRLLKGTSLRSTIIGVIPNTSDPTSDCDDLPALHRPMGLWTNANNITGNVTHTNRLYSLTLEVPKFQVLSPQLDTVSGKF